MKKQRLGWTDLELSAIGLGTWAMGGAGWSFSWGPQDDKDSIKTIHRALDLGVNWIDTAPAYGLGHAEEVVGNALAGMAEKPLIATKCARTWDEKGNLTRSLKRDSIRKELEISLKRLRIETIDLLQVHWPLPEEDLEEGWSAIGELIKEGRVRYAGVSNFNMRQMQRCQVIHPIASLQPPYSMIVRDVEKEILPFCQASQIGVVAYSPMYRGLLTGRFSRDRMASLPEEDHRHRDKRFHDPELSIHLILVEELRKLAAPLGKTVGHLAIAWVLRQPAVTSAIVGSRHPEQIEALAAAGDWDLAQNVIDQIELFLQQHDTELVKI